MSIQKPLDRIDEQDLINLVINEQLESITLDYKKELTLQGDDKREFVYDVMAFANAVGGDLIFGIEEQKENGKNTGKPSKVEGIQIPDYSSDSLILRLEDILRTNIQPRIYGLQMKAVYLQSGNYVLIIRIPSSLNAPHMSSMGGTQRFYTRTSAGKHMMDSSEIRNAFLATVGIGERIRDLRLERLAKIRINQGPMKLVNIERMLVMQLIPFSAFDTKGLDIPVLMDQDPYLLPLSSTTRDWRVNFDGYLTFNGEDGNAKSYVQFFKNGIIEAVWKMKEENNSVTALPFQYETIKGVYRYLNAYNGAGIRPPFVILISLLNVEGLRFDANREQFNPIDRADLLLPEVVFEEYPTDLHDIARKLRPAFDAIWNAGGYVKARYYKNGEWTGGI